jgi:hypothetical protein
MANARNIFRFIKRCGFIYEIYIMNHFENIAECMKYVFVFALPLPVFLET